MDPRRSTALRHLEYNAWATQKVLDSVQSLSAEELNRDMQTSHSSILGTLNHTFQADALWLNRLQGDSGAKLDGIASVAELANLRTAWSHVQGDFLSWAGGLNDSDWATVIDYKFMNGEPARSPIYESILHVVNHGSYHRGQIVTLLRQLGAKPFSTDFIAYVRTMMTF